MIVSIHYHSMSDARSSHRNFGLELPDGSRHLERHLLSARAKASQGVRRARLLRQPLRHGRGELHVLRTAEGRRVPRLGRSDACRASSSPSSCIRSSRIRRCTRSASPVRWPGAVARDDRVTARLRSRPSRSRTRRTSTSSAAGSIRSRRAGKLGALLAQFPPSFKETPASRDYLAQLLAALAGLPGGGGTASPELERSDRRDAGAAQRVPGRVGANRRAEVQALDQAELPAERRRASITCGFTDGMSSSGGGTQNQRIATTTSTRPTSCGNSRTRQTPHAAWSRSCISTRTTTSRRSRWRMRR